MAWIYLVLAGLMEVGWATALKYSCGFTRFWPSATVVAVMGLSIWFLALALRQLPMGTAYAVWTGIGAVGTVLAGIVLFGDSVAPLRLCCLGLIALGIIGLKIVS